MIDKVESHAPAGAVKPNQVLHEWNHFFQSDMAKNGIRQNQVEALMAEGQCQVAHTFGIEAEVVERIHVMQCFLFAIVKSWNSRAEHQWHKLCQLESD